MPQKAFSFAADAAADGSWWEVNGSSPGNTPMAKLQALQLLIPLSHDPATGIDPYELVRVFLANGPLANAKDVQRPKEQSNNRNLSFSGGAAGSDANGPLVGQAGSGSIPGLPQQSSGPGPAPMYAPGPVPFAGQPSPFPGPGGYPGGPDG